MYGMYCMCLGGVGRSVGWGGDEEVSVWDEGGEMCMCMCVHVLGKWWGGIGLEWGSMCVCVCVCLCVCVCVCVYGGVL